MRRKARGALLLLTLFIEACQPDKPAPASPTTATLLTGGNSRTWRLQTLSERGNSQPIPPCRADDRWTFRSDGSGTFQNPTACDANDPNDPTPSASIQWRLTNSDRFLVIQNQTLFLNREIIQLSDNILVWEYTGSSGALVQETWVPN